MSAASPGADAPLIINQLVAEKNALREENERLRKRCDEEAQWRLTTVAKHAELTDKLREKNEQLRAIVKDLLGDQPSVQGGICQHCGRDFIEEILSGDCPSDDCPSYLARQALAGGGNG